MNGPTLIDNVKQEDKDAIVAAQFYFPNLNTVQRSGQQRVIPLPIPVLTKNAPKKFYNKRPFAATAAAAAATNNILVDMKLLGVEFLFVHIFVINPFAMLSTHTASPD